MSSILKKFPNEKLEPDEIIKTEGVYYHLKNGKKLLDTTSGWTGHASMGFCNPRIIKAIKNQMEKFTHIDLNHPVYMRDVTSLPNIWVFVTGRCQGGGRSGRQNRYQRDSGQTGGV